MLLLDSSFFVAFLFTKSQRLIGFLASFIFIFDINLNKKAENCVKSGTFLMRYSRCPFKIKNMEYNSRELMMRYAIIMMLILTTWAANKEEWKKRSIYQLLTDRFARNDGRTDDCSNLGTLIYTKVTTAEVGTRALKTILTIFTVWASMRYGFHPLLTTEMEGTMDIGPGICTN